MTELFVWYHCDAGDRERVLALAGQVLATVAARCGVQGRLLARTDQRHTWMEHYAPPEGQEEALRQALQHAVAALAQPFPQRHTEAFSCLAG